MINKTLKGIGIVVVVTTLLVALLFIVRFYNPAFLWYITRAAGITSFLMLFLLMMTGMGITSGYIYMLFGPVFSWRFHRAYGITLALFVVIHLVSLALDSSMNFSLAELFLPFYSSYKPLYMAMGIIGFYLFVVVAVTSLYWVVKRYQAWRYIHYLAFPAFILLFFHGLMIGTDSGHPIMIAIYVLTGTLVLLGGIYRLFM